MSEPGIKDEYPMRINKYLAKQGVATRRNADELVEKHRVYINDRVAVLGDKVDEGDKVEVRGGGKPKVYKYFAYNKPQGVITHSPQGEEIDIKTKMANIPEFSDVFPVGRLDKDSQGLLILTNDGRVTDRLLSPTHYHEKEYLVTVKDPLRSSFKENMEKGVQIEDYLTKPCRVQVMGEKKFRITLTEGKRHQIRRMVVALFNEVVSIKRVRVLNILLDTLPSNGHRPIVGEELAEFLEQLGL